MVERDVRLILLGRQGAGKGTQCARLAAHFTVPHVSTGEMLRNAVRHDTPVGRAVKRVLDEGGLVDDDLMVSLVQGRLGEPDARMHGYVLDGFPRTLPQAERFDQLTTTRPIDAVIDLEVSRDIVVGRLSARRTCDGCGAVHVRADGGPDSWTCESCGGRVEQRADDTPEAINRRLDLYDAQTEPLVTYYRGRSCLQVVDGVGSPDEVFARLLAAVDAPV